MKRKLACFLLLVPLAFGVDGQVFVSSKAGEVVKLDSVAIKAYNAADYLALVGHLGAEKKKYKKLGDRLSTLLEEFQEVSQSNTPEDEKTRLLERNSAETSKLEDEMENVLPSFLAKLPLKPVAETTTDADGNYTLPLKDPTHVVIIAVAERQFVRANGHYCWVIFNPPERLNLSSQTLTAKMPWDQGLQTGAN